VADFLTSEQRASYGGFAGEPSRAQLERYFRFEGDDALRIRDRRRAHNRLGFAIQLGTVRFLGTFLSSQLEVPAGVVGYVAEHLGVDAACFAEYAERFQTQHDHAREIRRWCGYRDFTAVEHDELERWLYTRASGSTEAPSVLFDLATARLLERRVLLPGVTTIARLVSAAREQAAVDLYERVVEGAADFQLARLEALAIVPDGARSSELDRLRRAPATISADALIAALGRVRELAAFELAPLDGVPPARVRALARYGAAAKAQSFSRLAPRRRQAILLATVHHLHATAIDDSLDLLDRLIDKLGSRIERAQESERARTRPALNRASRTMWRAIQTMLDNAPTDTAMIPAQAIFAAVSREELLACGENIEQVTRPPEHLRIEQLVRRYSYVRRFLPALLDTIAFDVAPGGQAVLEAIAAVQRIEGRRRIEVGEVPLQLVRGPWLELVLTSDGLLDRAAYTMCVLDQLRRALRRRDVFVPASSRYTDPRAQLISGPAWLAARDGVCASLNLPSTPSAAIDEAAEQLDDAYRATAARLDENDALQIVQSDDGRDQIDLEQLEKLPESAALTELRGQIAGLLPLIDLPDLLLEVNRWTGFMGEFCHVAGAGGHIDELDTSVCALLIAEACNVGIEPVCAPHAKALTRSRLSWVDQNYIRPETITTANERLVDYQRGLPLAEAFGSGELASVDGMRFVVPVRTINAGPNPRYFATGSGVTWLNCMSAQFAGLHALVVPGTIRDSLHLLDTILEQDPQQQPQIVTTDTASYSDQVFGLFKLLGRQFAPRLADLPAKRFWRIDPTADYGALNGIARHRINTRLISEQWDDLLRLAGSLHRGTVPASQVLRVLQGGGRPTRLGQALAEYGRIAKTTHMLAYIDDSDYRRQIRGQLNKHEARHSLARKVFYGQRGQLRQRYREGQEDQLGALGLVLNAIAIWNTRYMHAALDQLDNTAGAALGEHLARLSELSHAHINELGRYSFEFTPPLTADQLRPLREHSSDEQSLSLLQTSQVA